MMRLNEYLLSKSKPPKNAYKSVDEAMSKIDFSIDAGYCGDMIERDLKNGFKHWSLNTLNSIDKITVLLANKVENKHKMHTGSKYLLKIVVNDAKEAVLEFDKSDKLTYTSETLTKKETAEIESAETFNYVIKVLERLFA